MFDNLQNLGTTVFTWLDKFGHDHWGFILSVVFFLYIGDRAQFGLMRAHQRTQRLVSNYRSSRMPRTMPKRIVGTDVQAAGMDIPRPWLDTPTSRPGFGDLVGSSTNSQYENLHKTDDRIIRKLENEHRL